MFARKADPEVARAHEALLHVVTSVGRRLDEQARVTTALYVELRAQRALLEDLPHAFDAKVAAGAMALIADAHQRIGSLQQQVAYLSDSDALIELAADAPSIGIDDGRAPCSPCLTTPSPGRPTPLDRQS